MQFTKLLPYLLPLILLNGCPDKTKEGYLLDPDTSNPYPPYSWNPYKEWNMLKTDGSNNRLLIEDFKYLESASKDSILSYRSKSHFCESKVISLDVLYKNTETTKGNLKFDADKRRPDRAASIPDGLKNGNKKLGQAGNFYKYQVEIIFSKPLGCFYGQMTSNTVPIASINQSTIKFHDDSPANHWSKLGGLVGVSKKDGRTAPILEKTNYLSADGTTQTTAIRWIDAPEGGVGTINYAKYFYIYAGSCGIVTHGVVIEIITGTNGVKTATVLSEQAFKNKVKGISYNNSSL